MVFYPSDITDESDEMFDDDTSKIIEMEDGWNNCTVRVRKYIARSWYLHFLPMHHDFNMYFN